MTEHTADAPHAPEAPHASEPLAPAAADGTATPEPTPTVLVLTEEALKPVDVDKIVALHEDEAPTYRVLVPADTEHNLLSSFLDHLSLFEMREALDALRPVDRAEARVDA